MGIAPAHTYAQAHPRSQKNMTKPKSLSTLGSIFTAILIERDPDLIVCMLLSGIASQFRPRRPERFCPPNPPARPHRHENYEAMVEASPDAVSVCARRGAIASSPTVMRTRLSGGHQPLVFSARSPTRQRER
jgi:hypothetical protein